jgi:hypothetical protein
MSYSYVKDMCRQNLFGGLFRALYFRSRDTNMKMTTRDYYFNVLTI